MEIGYEPVRNETGSIPYGKDEPPENYAYREVELSDIIVSIIGGRFGSESQQRETQSISQAELKTALERGIQVFIFVEKSVYAEYSTYQLNKGDDNTKYRFVDDKRVYQFIEELHKLPRNNPIATFETSADIVKYVRSQWAGLFQRFLQEQKRISEFHVLEEMNSVATTLKQLVSFLTEERRRGDDAIQTILLANHSAFRRFAELTQTQYKVYFTDKQELQSWLSARTWQETPAEQIDDDSVFEWTNERFQGYLKLAENIFDENDRLRGLATIT